MFKVFFTTASVSGVGLSAQVCLFLIAAEVYIVKDFALIAFVMGLSVLLSQLLFLGIPQVSTRIIAKKPDDQYRVLGTLHTLLILSFLVALLSMKAVSLFTAFSCFLFVYKFILKRVSMGLSIAHKTVWFDELFWVIPPIIFAVLNMPFQYFKVVLLISLLLSCVFMHMLVFFETKKMTLEFDITLLKSMIVPAFFVVVFLIGRLFINRLDILIVKPWFDDVAFSAYSLGHRISYMATFLPLVFSVVFSGKVAKLYEEKNMRAIREKRHIAFMMSVFVSIVLLLIVLFFGETLLSIYSEGVFYHYYYVFVGLIIGQLIMSFSGVDQMILMMSGNEKYCGAVTLSGAMIACILCVIFVAVFDLLEGVAMTVILFSLWVTYFNQRRVNVLLKDISLDKGEGQ